ncbi:MAG: glycosyltransferase family 4 protein [Alphaproteobacteria bacterium]|nr:glycosyltransferase family 4 protein [Alphaproteobacteria bacterium]
MDNDLSFSLGVILATFALSLGLTGIAKKILARRALLDIPNERSSHQVPVPRGGGWAVVMILLPALAWAAFSVEDGLRYGGLLLGIVLLAAISWADDRYGVPARSRLSLHILAACLGVLAFSPQETLFGGAVPFWLDRTLMIVGWAWFINLYNFMDGIDGITGTETICIATGLCLVMGLAGIDDPFVSFATLALTGTCLGFLAYNWHPAKIFLGDIGSVPLGYITGFCLLTLAVDGHLAAAAILPLYYLADSGITITRRALKREKIWEAHRQHFYQHAARGMGHARTVLWIAAANAGLIGAALLAVSHVEAGLALAVVLVAVLLGKLHKTAL